tara:strand:+ start:7119 stop:8036 length:918 start_codon:yes stop_codon:yes gene_type:complete
MDVDIKVGDLKPKKLMVATPMYGGQCAGMFTKATNDLATACAAYGISLKFYYLFNESLITRARNYCVDEFLRSDCDYLMFIDSDIGFDYKDVLTLLHFAGTDDYDIVTGPYPKKTIAWEKIKAAVEQGYADENPFNLGQFVGDYVFNPVEGIKQFSVSEPVEIREGGTGFMMIPRKTFEKYDDAYPELKYIPDHARTEEFDGSREIMCYFDTVIDPESKRYLSEDYMFSQYARKAGMKIWLFPWMKLQHVGAYIFGGSLGAMAAIGASPTASKKSNKKNYLTKDAQDDTMTNKNRKQRRAAKKGK